MKISGCAFALAGAAFLLEAAAGPNPRFRFLSAEDGRRILQQHDEFVQRLSPFDRSARLKIARAVSEEEYLKFVGENPRSWNNEEESLVRSAINTIEFDLRDLGIPLPPEVVLIKTTGMEEGNAFYTRGNAIIFPQGELRDASSRKLARTIAHELFHILSRQHPQVREKLYAAIGFHPCAEPALPEELRERKITNPDAPRNDHAITVRVGGETARVVPVIFASTDRYDPSRGGEFFSYLVLKFLKLPGALAGAGTLLDLAQVTDFYEQVGRNTAYIIHPEEILADNFAALVLKEQNLPSPEIVERMRTLLK